MKNTCSNCKWWSDKPIKMVPAIPVVERLCLRSKTMSFGAYGQDGKAIIVCSDFGCNFWEEKQNQIKYNIDISLR